MRVSHVGICGSDLPKLRQPGRFALPEPWRPGHEIVGLHPTGHMVAVDPLIPCGSCPHCTTGDSHLCAGLRRLGWDLPGGFATQVVVPTANVHPLSPGTDPLLGVLADPAAVAIHGLRCNPVGPPGRLAVIGAGTVGLLTALYGYDESWAVTVIHRDGQAPPDAVTSAIPVAFGSPSALTQYGTFDAVIDAASGANPAPLELAMQLVRDGGAIVVQNAYHPDVTLPTSLRDVFRRSVRIIGSFSYCRQEAADFELALRLLDCHASEAAHLVNDQVNFLNLLDELGGLARNFGRQTLVVEPSDSSAA